MGSSTAMRRDKLLNDMPSPAMFTGTPPLHLLSIARGVDNYRRKIGIHDEAYTRRVKFTRQVCLEICLSSEVFQAIIYEVPINREDYLGDEIFQKVIASAEEIRQIVIEIFDSLENARSEFKKFVAKKSLKDEIEIDIDEEIPLDEGPEVIIEDVMGKADIEMGASNSLAFSGNGLVAIQPHIQLVTDAPLVVEQAYIASDQTFFKNNSNPGPQRGESKIIQPRSIEVIDKYPHLRFETYRSSEITPEFIQEIAEFSEKIFSDTWEKYVCIPCDTSLPGGMRLTTEQAAKISSGIGVVPDCPTEACGKKMELFHDSSRVRELIEARLSKNACLSVIRNTLSGKIEAFCHGRRCTLEEQFLTEWENKYNYMGRREPKYDRSLEYLIECLNNKFPDVGFSADTSVFCWNEIGISEKLRGHRLLPRLIDHFLSIIPDEDFDLWNIGQLQKDSKWHNILKQTGVEEVPGHFLDAPEILTGVLFRKSAQGFMGQGEAIRTHTNAAKKD